jgi:hypothetical protein
VTIEVDVVRNGERREAAAFKKDQTVSCVSVPAESGRAKRRHATATNLAMKNIHISEGADARGF